MKLYSVHIDFEKTFCSTQDMIFRSSAVLLLNKLKQDKCYAGAKFYISTRETSIWQWLKNLI